MQYQPSYSRTGMSLIEVILAIGMIVLLFGGIYSAYIGILDAIANSSLRTQAASILNREIEIIRNLAYDQVGTVGGIPSGILPQTKNVTSTDGQTFTVAITVRNIDDQFDGTLSGSPGDTSPADYKLAELEISCVACPRFIPLLLTTTVAPKNLEGALAGGALFINVFDAAGAPVQDAVVNIINSSVSPAVNLTDITNEDGVLQLVGVPTSTQGYAIIVTKNGYSTEQTYQVGAIGNPNPVKPHATIAAQSVTQVSFAIDRTSSVTLYSSTNTCQPIADRAFSIQSSKLLGTVPDVYKFSTTTQTGGAGIVALQNIEWDSYNVTSTGSGYDVIGSLPLIPFTVNPATNMDVRFVFGSPTLRSLLVSVKDAATGAGIQGATVSLSNESYEASRYTGRSSLVETTWTGGGYISQDGGIDTESVPGSVVLAGTPYPTSTTHWMISRTFDTGGATSTYYALHWEPETQPGGVGVDSVRFQIASNNDSVTWNYVGPDGTSGSYYTSSGTTIHSGHANHRYIRYKLYLSTDSAVVTPSVSDVMIDFNGVCVPPYQAYLTGMAPGTYTLSIVAPGYQLATSSITIGSGAHIINVPIAN